MRVITCMFGVLSLCWAVIASNIFLRSIGAEPLTVQILSEENFKDSAIANRIDIFDAIPAFVISFPILARAQAILRIRYLENALEKVDPRAIDSRMVGAKAAVEASLSATPSDSFLWLVLFWLKNSREGFDAENLKLMVFSYDLAPREGWVAMRRNRRALAMFDQLGFATQDKILAEFANLVESGALTIAALNLVGPGWSMRNRLLDGLKNTDIGPRERFAKMLSQEGFRLEIPGVVEGDYRPWR